MNIKDLYSLDISDDKMVLSDKRGKVQIRCTSKLLQKKEVAEFPILKIEALDHFIRVYLDVNPKIIKSWAGE